MAARSLSGGLAPSGRVPHRAFPSHDFRTWCRVRAKAFVQIVVSRSKGKPTPSHCVKILVDGVMAPESVEFEHFLESHYAML